MFIKIYIACILLITLLVAERSLAWSAPAVAADAEARPALEHIQVTATRRALETSDVAGAVGVVRMENAQRVVPGIVAEALRGQAGTFFQQTTPGQGIPIIRGLKGSQLLHLVDGMRLNNAFFRDAPNQYLSLVDAFALDGIEVLRGAAGSLYGADAMGGVVQLRSPELNLDGAARSQGRLFGAWNSADGGRTLRADTTLERSGAALAGGVTWQKYSNRRTGGGEVIRPSGWESRAGDLRLAFAQGDAADWLLSAQVLEQPSTPRVDEMVPGYGQSEPSAEVALFEPNRRSFLHARFRRDTGWRGLGNLEAHLARQVITDDRVSQDYGATRVSHEHNDSTLDGLTVQFVSEPAADWRLAWGVELYRDTVRSARYTTDVDGGAGAVVAPRFPDRSSMDSDAVFGTLGWQATTRLELDAGLRYSAFDIALPASGASPSVMLAPDDLSGDLRALLHLGDNLRLVANVSRGFRPPNVFDLGALGPRPGNRFNVANPDLGPETVWSYDAGVKFSGPGLQAELFGFLLDYRDRITSVLTGELTADGREVVRSENLDEVRLFGIEGGLRWLYGADLDLYAVLNYTRGEERSTTGADTPADRVPPLNGRLGLLWRASDRLEVEPFVAFAARQDRLSLRDQTDPRINPDGTPGWATVNLRLQWRIDERYLLGLNIENPADRNYREHGSGIDARGRNLGLWLDARF